MALSQASVSFSQELEMITADRSSVQGEWENVTKCFYVNGCWRIALHRDLNIQHCILVCITKVPIVKCSYERFNTSLSLQRTPRERKKKHIRRRVAGSPRKTWQSLHQSEVKVGHVVVIKVIAQYIKNTAGLQVPNQRSKEDEMKDCFSNIRKDNNLDKAMLFWMLKKKWNSF